MPLNILSCDGGGIRGLITALLIQNLEEIFPDFLDMADGFAGTSTGGLIALGLTRGKPVGDIVDIYKTKGAEIFTPNGWTGAKPDPGEPADDAPLSGPGIRVCQYKSDGLKKLAEQILGTDALRDAKKMVAVTSAQLWDAGSASWRPRTLSSIRGNDFRGVSMVDAALATSAAPTYFPPHEISEYLGYFADGGLFANNPALTAISEALAGGLVVKPSDIRVLSIGTGQDPQGIPPAVFKKYKPLSWGTSKWLWPASWGTHVPAMAMISLMFDATAASATAAAEQLLGDAFCRANVPLDKPYPLDDYEQVGELETWTREYMAGESWREVRAWVEKNWT